MSYEIKTMHNDVQTPEEESQNNNRTNNNPHRKRKKKFRNKKQNKKDFINKKKSKFALSMSSWAETFTVAATWQLKHQLAYWKAKATALEYENKILHDIIRKNHCHPLPEAGTSKVESDLEDSPNGSPDDVQEFNEDEDDEHLEVSEEFIEFLRANAKYKEDARQERELLKAKQQSQEVKIEQLEAEPPEREDSTVVLKELYGDKWQRIASLEMSLQSRFMSVSDKEKPVYWPNIPFNFNFSGN